MKSKSELKYERMIQETIQIEDLTSKGFTPWADGLAEWTKLEAVFTHRPGIETSLASLDFKTNLFLDVFYLNKAQEQHDNLRKTLQEHGVAVITAADLVEYLQPEDLAQFINFNGSFTQDDISELLENYIEDHKQLDVLLTQPQILRHGETEEEYSNKFTLSNPLGNFFYSRDPVFQTGDNSFVLANLKYAVRRNEMEILELLFSKINKYIPKYEPEIIHTTPKHETIEGGEVVPLGDTMLIGVESQRTTLGSVYDLMQHNAVGHSKVAAVISPVRTLTEMHIDTWFNVIDDDLFVASRDFLDAGVRILVYERDEDKGQYKIDKTHTDLEQFLINKCGMEMIGLNHEEQKDLMSNGLTIGPRQYVMIDGKGTSNSFLRRLEDHNVDVIPVELDELTDGLGGAHCMTQPIKREFDMNYVSHR